MTAKKKNPLKDLDAFLKQEASSLVTPEKVEKAKEEKPLEEMPAPPQEEASIPTPPEEASIPIPPEETPPQTAAPEPAPQEVSAASIMTMLQALKTQDPEHFEDSFYEIVLKTAETLESDKKTC